MTINIRKPEVDKLARRLAAMEGKKITEVVEIALKEAVANRIARESPSDTATRIMREMGIIPSPTASVPVDRSVYFEFDPPELYDEPAGEE